jgi:hypothetical protein
LKLTLFCELGGNNWWNRSGPPVPCLTTMFHTVRCVQAPLGSANIPKNIPMPRGVWWLDKSTHNHDVVYGEVGMPEAPPSHDTDTMRIDVKHSHKAVYFLLFPHVSFRKMEDVACSKVAGCLPCGMLRRPSHSAFDSPAISANLPFASAQCRNLFLKQIAGVTGDMSSVPSAPDHF